MYTEYSNSETLIARGGKQGAGTEMTPASLVTVHSHGDRVNATYAYAKVVLTSSDGRTPAHRYLIVF